MTLASSTSSAPQNTGLRLYVALYHFTQQNNLEEMVKATINKGTEDDATTGMSAHTQSTAKDSFHKTTTTKDNNSSEDDNSSTSKNDKFNEPDVSQHDDDNEGHDGVHMRSGQGWGKGIVQDVKRTLGTHWKKEMTNLNSKVRDAMKFFVHNN